MIDSMKRTPWAHQREAFEFAKTKRGAMLAMDMGTGKSYVTVALCKEHKAKKILILSPLSVVNVWPREFDKHSSGFRVVPLDTGTVAKKTELAGVSLKVASVTNIPCVIVVNYESAWREPFKSFALSAGFDLVVLDESHRVKAPGGKASRFVGQFTKKGCRVLALTGTPAPHSPLDVYGQFRAVAPDIYGTSFNRFKRRYSVMGGYQNYQVVGYKNQGEMKELFDSVAITIKKEDALDLPELTHVEIPVTMSKVARGIYDAVDKEFFTEVESGLITIGNALVKLLKMQQITGGFVKDDEGNLNELDDAKAQALKDLLTDCDKPVVVFCRFTQDIQTIRAVAESLKLRHGEVSGQQKDLDQARYPKDKDVLAVQIQAGGVGIDLTRASNGVYYSVGFSLGDYLQSLARLHRPGQKKKVTFYHLVATKTVDEKVYKALQDRKDIIKEILGV